MFRRLIGITAFAALCVSAHAQTDLATLGPQVGQRAIDFSLPDQTGRVRTLASAAGPKGTMLVFFRSADWWPYCRTQLVQLQRSLPDIQRAGLGLVAVSYDSVDTLRAFAEKHAVTFPMLSDQGSKTIAAWGIQNREATGRTAGIPYPGTYILDPKGVIVSRNFEEAYQERDSAASIIAALKQSSATQAPGASKTDVLGRYLRLGLGATDAIAAPGHRITLTVDLTPGQKIHVYAPGQASYIPIALKLNDSPDWKAAAAVFPQSTRFVDPVGERVQVYDRPFRITQNVTLALTPSMRQRATARESLVVSGTLEYQACDDKICYRPETIPVQWTLALTPIEPWHK